MQSARPALFESTIKSLPLLGRGKVRDIYAVVTISRWSSPTA